MPAHKCSIGHPWIIDLLAKYKKNVKYKPVTAQVVEFVKMLAVSSDDSQGAAAVVHISDRKYYIRGVITREAQVTLEREDEHFTLGDIKNKIIILKNYNVVFTAVEDLNSCEFSITVHHFTILPMETNSVDLLNCNMNPAVRRKIKELWQNYMEEQAMNASSAEMSLSDISLTQLLNIACEEKLAALKSLAEQCLDIDQPSNQVSPQAMTKWGKERMKNKDANTFNIPLDLLLIPPEEEAALAQITNATVQDSFSNDVPSDMDTIADHLNEKEPSSSSYSTALSNQSDDYFEDVPATQSVNPWNNLQPLSLTSTPSSTSQAKASSSEAQQNTDEDTLENAESEESPSYAQHLLWPPVRGSSESQQESSPLIFSDRMGSREAIEESTNVLEMVSTQQQNVSSNSGLTCGQRKIHSDRTTNPPLLLPLKRTSLRSITISPINQQTSPKSRSSPKISHGRLCPVVLSDSERESSPIDLKHVVYPSEERAKKHEDKTSLRSITISPINQQTSPRSRFCLSSHGGLCPVVLSDSERESSPSDLEHLVYPEERAKTQDKMQCYPLRGRKAKRKTLFADSDTSCSDAESPDLEHLQKIEQKKFESNASLVLEDLNVPKLAGEDLNESEKASSQMLGEKDRDNLFLFSEKNQSKEERTINYVLNPKLCTKSLTKMKHSLQSIESTRSKGETAKRQSDKASTSKHLNGSTNNQGKRKNIQLTLDFSSTKMVHYDGTAFQYKYTTPSAELCARVDTIRLPADLCEWARKILLEPENRVS